MLLGSTGRALARRAPVSLLVVRALWEAPRQILAAVDGSAESDIAMDLLSRLPLPADIEITLLHLLPESEPMRVRDDAVADELRAIRQRSESERADEALARATSALRGRRVEKETNETRTKLTTVVKVIEVIGTSKIGFDDAIATAIKTASHSLRHITGADVKHMTVAAEDGKITEYKVDLKLAFALEPDEEDDDD